MFDKNEAFSSFAVSDLEAAKRFYGTTLGLDVRDTPMGVLDLTMPSGATVMVYPKPDFVPATYTILNFRVEDIGAAVDALTKAGVTMEHYDRPEIKTDDRGIARDDGQAIAWFTDPAGNILSVLETR